MRLFLCILGFMVVSCAHEAKASLTCGGFAGYGCPEGYWCKFPSEKPLVDGFGVCVKQ